LQFSPSEFIKPQKEHDERLNFIPVLMYKALMENNFFLSSCTLLCHQRDYYYSQLLHLHCCRRGLYTAGNSDAETVMACGCLNAILQVRSSQTVWYDNSTLVSPQINYRRNLK
jgi:hypothetical protein